MLKRERGRERERNTWAWQADKQRQRREAARQMPFACKDNNNKHRQAAWTMAPGQRQRQDTRLAFWQRNNSILFSLCFAEAVAFVQATLLSCRRPEQRTERQMQKEPEKRFGLACRRFYALARCLYSWIFPVLSINNVAKFLHFVYTSLTAIIHLFYKQVDLRYF